MNPLYNIGFGSAALVATVAAVGLHYSSRPTPPATPPSVVAPAAAVSPQIIQEDRAFLASAQHAEPAAPAVDATKSASDTVNRAAHDVQSGPRPEAAEPPAHAASTAAAREHVVTEAAPKPAKRAKREIVANSTDDARPQPPRGRTTPPHNATTTTKTVGPSDVIDPIAESEPTPVRSGARPRDPVRNSERYVEVRRAELARSDDDDIAPRRGFFHRIFNGRD